MKERRLEITEAQYNDLLDNPQRGVTVETEVRYIAVFQPEHSKRKQARPKRRSCSRLVLSPSHKQIAAKLTGQVKAIYRPVVAAIEEHGRTTGCTGAQLKEWIQTDPGIEIKPQSIPPAISALTKAGVLQEAVQ
jgi:hypothetical protein